MATRGWGRCNRCGSAHTSIMMRGPCDRCLKKEQDRAFFTRIATPEKLRQHPDLAEIELMVENFYG